MKLCKIEFFYISGVFFLVFCLHLIAFGLGLYGGDVMGAVCWKLLFYEDSLLTMVFVLEFWFICSDFNG